MNSNVLRNILVAGLASAAFASCAPMKTSFLKINDQYAALGAVAEFDKSEEECSDGSAEASILADGAGNAFLVRSECENFEEPVKLNPEELESSPSGEEIRFQEEIFELKREEGAAELPNREEPRAELPRREEPRAEIPKSNTEVPRVNTEIPKTNTEVPHVNTEVPKVNTEVQKTNTEVPKPSTEGKI